MRRARFYFSRFVILACTAVFVAHAPALAGGPLILVQPGQPFLWPNGGVNIPFNPDQGGLGPLTNAEAVDQTMASFAAWQKISTATATYVNAGLLSFDVDANNFVPFLFFSTLDGLNPIIYDEDGAIFDILFGPGTGILGFAGPQFVNSSTGEILEAFCFLNGGAIRGGFTVSAFFGVQVHEFGHYSNLAHTVVNGQNILFRDESGPTPFNTFGNPPLGQVETMYPFILVGGGGETLHADDIAIFSTLYPAPGFFATSGTITGLILASNETTRLRGVNVIARNTANPFDDAVSAISGDFTESFFPTSDFNGRYTLNGLTPGADYAIFVDRIQAGGFSTFPLSPLPGPEEFYNGANESNDPDTDDPSVFVPVTAVAGAQQSGIDIIFNGRLTILPLGDDDFVELFLPFEFKICGEAFNSVFVNSNGNLTFGAGDTDFSESTPDFLSGPPRIAALWDDLNPETGGVVFFEQDMNKFSVRFENVPEFPQTGSNTFEITLQRAKNEIEIEYADLSAPGGLAGLSCGGSITSGFEEEVDLSSFRRGSINARNNTALFERFTGFGNDLSNLKLVFTGTQNKFDDDWAEPNDSIMQARKIKLPFDTIPIGRFSEIEPAAGDVDYYLFTARAGETLVAEIIHGNLDSLIGVFDAKERELLAFDDDGGSGLLSRLVFTFPADGKYALAVTTSPDFDFEGEDGFGGGRYVLDIFPPSRGRTFVIPLADDDSVEVVFGFDFPFQGANRNSVFVNSNGNLTFGQGDIDFTESVGEFLNGPPRIAPLWDDLNPEAGGLVIGNEVVDSLTISFIDVPEFFSFGSNTFSVTLHSNGDVAIDFDAVSAPDGLVGLTQGAGATDPGETNLSAAASLFAGGTTYELFRFGDTFDLDFSSLLFVNVPPRPFEADLLATTNRGELVEIDLDLQQARLIGIAPGPGWTGLSFDDLGNLFVSSRHRFEPEDPACTGGFYSIARCAHLYRIDPATGAILQDIGSTNIPFLSDIDFGSTLYASFFINETVDGDGGLASLNLSNAEATFIGRYEELPGGLENGGLSVHPQTGEIWVVENDFSAAPSIFKVDPQTGRAIAPVGLGLNGVPAPFGMDALEILPDGRFIATRGGPGSSELYEIDPVPNQQSGLAEMTLIPLNLPALSGSLNGLEGVLDAGGGDLCVPTHGNEKGPRCSDGIDNDCDGLVDGADPDC